MKGVVTPVVAGLVMAGIDRSAIVVGAQSSAEPAIVGRWDLVVQDADGQSPAWLEVQRGRYEVQIEDTAGRAPASDHLGAVYGFMAANEDAARPAGEWQTFDITLIARLVTVVVNGSTVIASQEIPGITGGALDSDEGAPGPLMLQGDPDPENRSTLAREDSSAPRRSFARIIDTNWP
jgi:hypothetical protein